MPDHQERLQAKWLSADDPPNSQAVWQQELVYNAQYQLAMVEHKVERASGGARTVDESAALIEQLEARRAELQPAKAEHADMQAALRSAEAALGESSMLQTSMYNGSPTG
jgi:molybdenum-dependent DNA-binding transcriptional regulator ModE